MCTPADSSGMPLARHDRLPPKRHGEPRPGRTLLVAGIFLILANFAGAAWLILDRRATAIAAAEHESASLSMALAEQTARTFQATDLVLKDIVARTEAQNVKSKENLSTAMGTLDAQRTLSARVAGLSQLDALYIAGRDGQLLNSSRFWPVPDLNLADRNYFRALRDNANADRFISPPIVNRATGTSSIIMARRISAPDGTFLGLVAANIQSAYFEDFYHAVATGDGLELSLWRRDGTLVASYPGNHLGASSDLHDPAPFEAIIGSAQTSMPMPLAHKSDVSPRVTIATGVTEFGLLITVSRSDASIRKEWVGPAIGIGIGTSFSGGLLLLSIVSLARQFTRRHEIESTLRQHRDQLEREVAERTSALATSEGRHRDLAELASDWFWETDANQCFTFVSERFAEAAGIPISHFIGRTPEQLHEAGYAQFTASELREAFMAQRPFRDIIQQIRFPDGRKRYWRVSAKPMFDPETGTFLGFRGTGSDVTESVENQIMLTSAFSRAEAADEQARRDRAKLLDAIDVIPAGFALWDAEDRLELCNARYREMSSHAIDLLVPGVGYEEFLRAAARRGGMPSVGEDIEQWIAERVAKHRAPGEVFVQRRTDGRWMQVGERRTADGGIVGTYSDVTELQAARDRAEAAEEQARRDRTRLLEAIEALPAGITLWDAEDRLELCNENYRRLFPKTAELMVPGLHFADLLRASVERGQSLLEGQTLNGWLAERIALHRSPHTSRLLQNLGDGRSIQVEERPMADGGIIGIRTDVTQLAATVKRAEIAEEQARHARARLLEAIDVIPAGFVMWDAEDRLELCNARYRELYGSSIELLTPGVRFEDIVRAAANRLKEFPGYKDADAWIAERLNMHRLAWTAKPGGVLYNTQNADGRWIQVDERPTVDGGLVGTRIDVTEILKREAGEREREKLAALGHLAGGVAHEINNLLQPAIIFPELVAERLPVDDLESREDLNTILESARKARDIVKNILRFARKEELELDRLNAVTEVKAALAFVRDLVPPSVILREALEETSTDGVIAANKTQLTQVITNLIVNAAQAMDDHGTVTVAIREERPTPAVADKISVEANRPYIAISVADTGPGMDAATQARIFEPFFTTKPIGKGTGLGLSVVYGILKNWKGAITVASEPGHGATFTLYIPTLTPEATPLALTG